jgi:hypothetical protein
MARSVTSKATLLVCLSTTVFVAGASRADAGADLPKPLKRRPDQVIVKFHDGVDATTALKYFGAAGR